MALLLRNRGAVLLLMFNILLVFIGIGLVIPVMPTYMRELHLNGSIVGLMVAAFSLTQLLFSPLAGRLSDTYGRKKNIVFGVIIFAISEFLFGMVSEPVYLFAARMLGGIGAALIMPSVMAYIADVTTVEERAKGMGYINAAITTGFIIGPGIGGILAEYGTRVPFYAAGIAGVISALLTIFILPDSGVRKVQKSAKLREATETSFASQLLRSYREPYFLSLIIVLVASFGLANYETVFGLFVDQKFGFTAKDIAIIITFGSIAGAVVQVTIFGWILNRFGERNVISASLLTAGLFVLLTLFTKSYWMILAVTFVLFLSIDILRPAIGTQISKMANEQQGYLAGLNSAFTSLGNIVGPIVAGFLFDIDINFPYISASIVLFLCCVLSVRAAKGDKRKANG
ncbi:MFS transporter [Paenibacillus luteus]|uniref:MFS transporter n=1 Tax=Paenibacillus luteus TaxID=2545753 RepID=UPI0011428C93|nr:MFS transporter [Paenibacillus luteus]